MRLTSLPRRTAGLVAATISAALLLAACGGGGGTTGGGSAGNNFDLVSAGTLTVCSDVPFPPFETEAEGGGYSGFDMDLMRAIAQGLNLKMQVKDVGFEGLQSGATLAASTCDIGASAMTITDERAKNLDFSDPYYDADQSLLVSKASGISGIEDLAGKRVGVQQGTTGQDYAEANAPDSAKIVAYPSDAEEWSALQAGQVDALLQDLPPNLEHTKDSDKVEIVATFKTNEHYGFAVKEKGSEKLLTAVNKQLSTLKSDGSYDKFYDKYFKVEE